MNERGEKEVLGSWASPVWPWGEELGFGGHIPVGSVQRVENKSEDPDAQHLKVVLTAFSQN